MTEERKSRGDLFLLSVAPEEMSQPPSVKELLALHRGELSEAEEQRIRRALVYHPDSRELLAALGLNPLEDSSGLSDELPPEVVSADLDAVFQAESEEDLRRAPPELEKSNTRPASPFPSPSHKSPLRNLLPLAAMLLFGAVLGTVVGPMLLRPADEPRLAPTESRTLLPDGFRGGGSGAAAIALPRVDQFRLELQIFEAPPYSDYRVELVRGVDSDARLIQSRDGFSRSPEDTFEVDVDRGSLPSGIYQIRLYGLRAGAAHGLATYTVEF